MAKITTLPFAGPLTGAEPVIVVQDGEARQSTIGAVVEEVAQPYVDEAQANAENVRGTLGVETLGRPEITSTLNNGSNAGLFMLATPVKHSGTWHTVGIRNGTSGTKTLKLGRYRRLEDGQFERVPGSALTSFNVPGQATTTITIAAIRKRGEILGLSVPTNGHGPAFDITQPGDSGGYWYHNVAEPEGPFTPSGGVNPQTGIQLQFGIEGDYALAYDDLEAELDPRIDALEVVAPATAATVSQVVETTSIVALSRMDSANTTFVTGTPVATAWAPGWLGTSIGEDVPIRGLMIRPHRPAGAESFRVQLFSRPIATTTVPTGADHAEWAAPITVSASSIAEGTFGNLPVNSSTTVLNDQARSYCAIVEALNAEGAVINLGYGRGGDGTSLTQVQRGFYRLANGTWTTVGASAALAIEVLTDKPQIRASALPATGPTTTSAGPSKKRGLLLMLGRTNLTFDNTTPTTHRRVFTVPANIKRIRRVIFSHSSTFQVPVTLASIASLTSVANFAAAGAAWQPLTFNGGAPTGGLPPRAGANRYAMLASDPANLTLLDRTDVPGAGKLVIVSAFLGGGGSPVLLGQAGTDDYRTDWEARADFPSVMRWNTGDCVTNPANFTSTDNRVNGTPIAGLEVECDDGEVMTLGFVGDSITNGAGITGANGVRYGQGWAEKLAYGLNTRHRGVLPVLLGWSGTSMTNIRANAVDLYDFCAAQGLPVPNILFAPNASPNSMGTPLLESAMTAQRALSDELINKALGAGSQVVKWLVLPVDPATKDLDPSTDPNDGDKFRRNYNDADRALANAQTGVVAADFDAAMSLGFDADGQALFNDAYEDDGIHPNAAGHDLMRDIGTRAARAVMPAAGYAVGGLVT